MKMNMWMIGLFGLMLMCLSGAVTVIGLVEPANNTNFTYTPYFVFHVTSNESDTSVNCSLEITQDAPAIYYNAMVLNNSFAVWDYSHLYFDLPPDNYTWRIWCNDSYSVSPSLTRNFNILSCSIWSGIEWAIILGLGIIAFISAYVGLNVGHGEDHQMLSVVFLFIAVLSIPIILFVTDLFIKNQMYCSVAGDQWTGLDNFFEQFFIGSLGLPILLICYFLYLMVRPFVNIGTVGKGDWKDKKE